MTEPRDETTILRREEKRREEKRREEKRREEKRREEKSVLTLVGYSYGCVKAAQMLSLIA